MTVRIAEIIIIIQIRIIILKLNHHHHHPDDNRDSGNHHYHHLDENQDRSNHHHHHDDNLDEPQDSGIPFSVELSLKRTAMLDNRYPDYPTTTKSGRFDTSGSPVALSVAEILPSGFSVTNGRTEEFSIL